MPLPEGFGQQVTAFLEAGERAFREAVGRALCVLAQASCSVTRVVCGIGVRIK